MVGGAIIDLDAQSGYLQFVGVKNEFQRRGIGSALISGVEKLLADLGTDQVFLGRGRNYLWQGVPYRGQGIGLALAVEATEELFKRGIDVSYLGWTWLEDWYKQLGYEKWRTFCMMRKSL